MDEGREREERKGEPPEERWCLCPVRASWEGPPGSGAGGRRGGEGPGAPAGPASCCGSCESEGCGAWSGRAGWLVEGSAEGCAAVWGVVEAGRCAAAEVLCG